MDQQPTDHSDLPTPADSAVAQDDLPPGSHPLEVAARRQMGPLSPLGRDSWHGQTRPCVSCGQLVLRDSDDCEYCDQDLSADMLEKMRAHAGPWYVLEHVRPFPGVNLERILRQIRRGVITETSIVRGPATDYQWRFALETPGLCRYFEKCCNCHEPVAITDTYCRECMASLTFDNTDSQLTRVMSGESAPNATSLPKPAQANANLSLPVPTAGAPTLAATGDVQRPYERAVGSALPPAGVMASVPSTSLATSAGGANELQSLSAAINQAGMQGREPHWDEPPRVAGVRATWIAVALLSFVIVVLMWLTDSRTP